MKFHVKISVWLCILSFIVSVLVYFGIIRYIQMYINTNEQMVEQYMKHNQTSDKTDVIVTLKVNDFSLPHLKPVINSLYDQTHPVSRIQINVPRHVYTHHSDKIKPLEKIVFVNVIEKDYDQHNDIMPVILFEKTNNTNVIRANDSIIYAKDFIESMIHHKNSKQRKTVVRLKQDPRVCIFDLDMIDTDFCNSQKDTQLLEYLNKKGVSVVETHLPENYRNVL